MRGLAGILKTRRRCDGEWHLVGTPLGGDDIYDVYYGDDGYWVIVGANGKTAYSTNPRVLSSWTVVATPTAKLLQACVKGTAEWVAAGGDEGGGDPGAVEIALDPTGVWSNGNLTSNPEKRRGIGFDGTYYVIGGESSRKIFYSIDPSISWSEINIGNPPWIGGGGVNYYRIKYLNGYMIMVLNAGGPGIAYSTSVTGGWIQKQLDGFLSTNHAYDIAYGDGYWVVSGNDISSSSNKNVIYTTSIAGTWTINTISTSISNTRGIGYGNGKWFVGTENNEILTTNDPTGAWSLMTSPFSPTSDVRAIHYVNGLFVAVCSVTGELAVLCG